MLIKVTSLEVVPPYKLAVAFNDGTRGIHDCAAMVAESKGVVGALADRTVFGQAFLDFGAPTWPNGFDMDPEWLRREMVKAGELKQAAAAE
jgi:hypothetical protein